MEDCVMTKIKKEAVELLQAMPDDKIIYIIKIMEGMKGLYEDEDMKERESAFMSLEQLCKSVPELDYEKN